MSRQRRLDQQSRPGKPTVVFDPVCLLCGAKDAPIVGYWSPGVHTRQVMGIRPTRAVMYLLCVRCTDRPNLLKRVEDAIVADVAAPAGMN